MGKATVTVTKQYEVAPEEVWAVVGDVRRLPEWLASHDSFVTEPGETRPGMEFRQKVQQMGQNAEVKWQVAEVGEPTRLVLDGKGPMQVKVQWKIEVAGTATGSEVSYTTEYQSMLLTGGLVGRLEDGAKTVMTESLRRLGERL